ncbi:MAG: HD domain-containing phosphohydrolase [Chloroflexia bacterium]
MAAIGVGTAIAYVVRRRELDEAACNASQAALQAGATSVVLVAMGWSHTIGQFEQIAQTPMLLVAAAVLYLTNTVLIAAVVAFHSGQRLLYTWVQSVSSFDQSDNVAYLSQFGIGFLAAMLVHTHSWALPLLGIPVYALYRAMQRHTQVRDETLDAAAVKLADVVDQRDPYTVDHSRRVAELSKRLATGLDLHAHQVQLIEQAARVHDIGKLSIDSAILNQRGSLGEWEWEQFRRYPVIGAQMLNHCSKFALTSNYVRHHHERVDGSGYPDRLVGDKIPLGARIISVAESFDAMTAPRPYRQALSVDSALAEFEMRRGRQWDSEVVGVLQGLVRSGQVVPTYSQLGTICLQERA